MFSKFSRTWELTKQSFAILAADKRLLLFPVISAIAVVVVSVSFALPLIAVGGFDSQQVTAVHYVILFGFYFVNYFVIVFFNSALVACANICLSGGHATLSDGLKAAWSRVGRIFVWALVAAGVGMALRVIEERSEKLGRIVAWLLGTAWTLMTYFIVPVLVFEDAGVVDSIKRSTRIFKDTWGEELASGFSFGLIWLAAILAGVALAAGGFYLHPLAGIVVALVYFLLLAVVAAAVKTVFIVALYRYATKREVPAGFSPELVQNAFGAPRQLAAGAGTIG